jgi:hypothetical protein
MSTHEIGDSDMALFRKMMKYRVALGEVLFLAKSTPQVKGERPELKKIHKIIQEALK